MSTYSTTYTQQILGAGAVQVAAETTTQAVTDLFTTNLRILTDVARFSGDPNVSVAAGDGDRLVQSMVTLLNLAKNGLPSDSNDPNSPRAYLTQPMAAALANAVNLFAQHGLEIGDTYADNNVIINNGNGVFFTATGGDALKSWLLAMKAQTSATDTRPVWVSSLGAGFVDANSAVTSDPALNRSFQAMVQLEYIATGNDVMSSQMTQLKDALTTTRDALSVLSQIQTIKNQLTAPVPNPTLNTGDPGAYQDSANAAFKNPLIPLVTTSLANFVAVADYGTDEVSNKLKNFAAQLKTLYQQLQTQNFISSGIDLSSNSTNTTPSADWSNSMQGQIATVYGDIGKFVSGIGNLTDPNNGATVVVPSVSPVDLSDLIQVKDTAHPGNILVLAHDTSTTDPSRIWKIISINPANKGTVLETFTADSAHSLGFPNVASSTNTVTVYRNTGFDTSGNSSDPTAPYDAFIYGVPRQASGYGWILDGQDQAATGQANPIQSNITQAITAGQNLNDSQKQNLNQFMFIFQEFYQSAAAILSSLNQLVVQFAQNIAR